MSFRIEDIWKGHFLIFEPPLKHKYTTATGWRLLIVFGILGFLVIPASPYGLRFFLLGNQVWSRLVLVCLFLMLFLLMLHKYIKTEPKTIGLHGWRDWTSREKIYFLQTLTLCLIIFPILFQQHLTQLIHSYGLVNFIAFSVLTGLLWGVVQEFIYRGLLQTELVRRYGAVAGILSANLVFTLGPLHLKYFHFGSNTPVQWEMFATIFCIGLLFGLIYQRSGNLWMPAIFHGLWPLNMP